MFTIKPNVESKWYQFRRQLSRFLVWLARKVDPKSPYVYAKFLEEMTKAQMDSMTYGQGAVKVQHVPFPFEEETGGCGD